MLMPTVNNLRVLDCEHNSANINNYRKDNRNGKSKLRKACITIHQSIENPPKMTTSISTNVTFEDSWCNIVVAKQKIPTRLLR